MKKIFVFGSNTQGIHGAGAAVFALKEHGAIYGIPMGLQGFSYGIITKHLPNGMRSVSLRFIQTQLSVLFQYALIMSNYPFYITRIGCGHAGFHEHEIAPMCEALSKLPNVELCPEFKTFLTKSNEKIS